MRRKYGTIVLFLAPSMLLIFVFVILPVFVVFFLSLTDFDMRAMNHLRPAQMVFFKNYVELFTHDLFLKSVCNTFYFMVLMIPATMVLALTVAILLNGPATHLRNFFKAGYFLPQITDAIAVTTVFFWLSSRDYGLVNYLLKMIGIQGPSWTQDARWAMPTIAIMLIWRLTGYYCVLYLAGLQSIPDQYYEAAEIDGAGAWQKVRHITIPLLNPTTLLISIMAIISGLQLFAETMVIQGPFDSTMTMMRYVYDYGFTYFRFGYAAAASVVLFVFTFVITMIQMKLRDKEVGY